MLLNPCIPVFKENAKKMFLNSLIMETNKESSTESNKNINKFNEIYMLTCTC